MSERGKATIGRDWPHQVALLAYPCTGHSYVAIYAFCDGERLSLCPRGHSFYRDGTDVRLGFAEHEHAENGGEFIGSPPSGSARASDCRPTCSRVPWFWI